MNRPLDSQNEEFMLDGGSAKYSTGVDDDETASDFCESCDSYSEDSQPEENHNDQHGAAEQAQDDGPPKRRKIKIVEVVYKSLERVSISDDVYNLTIAANMTKNVHPESLIYCIR